MKTEIRTLTATAALFLFAAVAQAQFNPGDLVVLRDGTGSGALSSAGTAIFLDQYTTSGAFVNSQAIPTTGSPALVNSGTAASEGQLSLSANGQYLVLAGYNVAAGTTGVAGSASSAFPAASPRWMQAGIIRWRPQPPVFTAATTFAEAPATATATFGVLDLQPPVARFIWEPEHPLKFLPPTALRSKTSAAIFFTAPPKARRAFMKFAGIPTSGIATPTLVLANATPSDFTFNANMTIAYVANTAGGIQRYDFNGTSWTLSYTLDSGTGMNGVAVNFSGTDPLIYATTEDGKNLIEITDAGSGSAATTLDTAGANEAFRGLDFSPQPVPEPSAWALFGLGLAGLWGFHRRNRKS